MNIENRIGNSSASNKRPAAAAAWARRMRDIAPLAGNRGSADGLTAPGDAVFCAPPPRSTSLQEARLLALTRLSHGIDTLSLGEYS